ncbi:hypothetical protein M2M59_10260 [Rummeliibacillus sp. G93]|uniref:hypothetical protein n=1 Tax=Rummeliibacillus sp. G93 TaxID=2939494 RepID=UPI00201B9E44|nr:hypothetical protein [Rummeliibacillus sp. G93]UQW96374.1 hypothetical protein M2M59_10260 [Rummeliibacillus sp. G93]
MNSLGQNKKVTTILVIALVFLIAFAIYYYLLMPKMEERDALNAQIKDTRAESATLYNQIKTMKDNQQATKKSPTELMAKVPTSIELSDLIKSIEQVELGSDTQIVDMAFNNYDASVKETLQTTIEDNNLDNGQSTNANNTSDGQAQATGDINTDENTNTQTTTDAATSNNTNTENANEVVTNEQNNDETLPVSPISLDSLPDSLKLVTMNVTVAAKGEKEIKEFLKEIEILPRIMRIDAVTYESPNKDVEASTESEENTKDELLQATIQLTTFYYVGQVDDQNVK